VHADVFGSARARWAFLAWLVVSGLCLRFGPPGSGVILVVLGIVLVGPFWTPTRYRINERGIERETVFGTTRSAWRELGGFALAESGGTAWVSRGGRGVGLFLPPLLLRWDERATPGLGARIASALETRLGPPRGGAR
jgi:hypothetical protein